jgi:hypothetical protein
MAPGWAEAALAVMLGLLATTVAVVCERHLEGRIRRADRLRWRPRASRMPEPGDGRGLGQ